MDFHREAEPLLWRKHILGKIASGSQRDEPPDLQPQPVTIDERSKPEDFVLIEIGECE